MRKQDKQSLINKVGIKSYHVLFEKGTEPAFSGEYQTAPADGIYSCKYCDSPLFSTSQQFESGCGWPSFDECASNDAVTTKEDISHGMKRVEILCAKCEGHLGHVFEDGPTQTGLRYCVNSLSLQFKKTD